ncbi:hypothetical protein HU200_004115 [Digitaria exilis]|uniref:alpha-1,2-Mannosidase n=1 Tax=Digitaria exilis TaxID=1010633 RepID=A0A835FVE6_9POAL|nr:hypothetical protein HU200_004115 [Digitaria exilis]
MRSPEPSLPAPARLVAVALLLAVLTGCVVGVDGVRAREEAAHEEQGPGDVYHAYDNYMTYGFPLEHLPQDYNGSALDTGRVFIKSCYLSNITEFERGILWLSENLTFDVDARINLFECNIRLLGGLISAHLLAKDYSSQLKSGLYHDQLLHLAESLGNRFLPAFETPTGLPYAWINLKVHIQNFGFSQTSKGIVVCMDQSFTCSLILEMGVLSRLTGDSRYEAAALRALRKLWSMRSSLNLVGTTLDVFTGKWIEYSSGIGAGVDSFYEYLIKAYILFGSDEYWDMFMRLTLRCRSINEADMRTGEATHWQLTSLQAFGQVFRYLLDYGMLHPTEKYYPLRPEFAESHFIFISY